MQAIDRQPQRAPDGTPVHYERHRPEQTTLYRLVQQHAASFIAHTEASTGSELPRFIKDEFDAFLECGILAHGFCPSCGARHMSQTAAHLVDHVIPHVPVRQWVLSLPIPLRLLLAAQPELVTPVLQEVQRVLTRHLLHAAELKADEGHGGAVTLIQRFGSAANLNVHLHCLVLDGVYRCDADVTPTFVEAVAPTGDELQALLQTVITRLMKMLTRRGVLIAEMGQTYLAKPDADGDDARTLRPLQAAAITLQPARLCPPWRHIAVVVRVNPEIQANARTCERSKTRRLDSSGSPPAQIHLLQPAADPAGSRCWALPSAFEIPMPRRG